MVAVLDTDESGRLRQIEIDFAVHEEECNGRHRALAVRLDRIEAVVVDIKKAVEDRLGVPSDAVAAGMRRQDWFGLARALSLAVIFLLGLSHHPKALFDLMDGLLP